MKTASRNKHGIPAGLGAVAAVFLVCLLPGCSDKKGEPAGAGESGKEKAPESRIKRGTNGLVIITLDDATQKTMGLQVRVLEPATVPPEVKAYGRVLDVTQLATQITEVTVGQAAAQASRAELQRLKTLAEQNNASQRALQTAEAAATRDVAQVEAARLRLTSSWGSGIATLQDLGAFAESLASLSNALVQLSLPADETLDGPPSGARVLTLATNAEPIPAKFLGPMPSIEAQLQGRGFLFLVSPNEGRLLPGSAVTGYLELTGQPQAGVLLPREAVVRSNGATWVYRQASGQAFEKIEVTLEEPLRGGWFVRRGLKAQEKVVTVGAQFLLSEEYKPQMSD